MLVVAISALCTAAAFAAASKHGVTPTAPKRGATVPVASRPIFKGKVDGPGRVFVYVSKSRKTNAKGVLVPGVNAMSQEAKRTGGTFKTKAKFFNYPKFWLNSPGTYYWQAHRIACEGGNQSDCLQEGPIVKFKVG